MCAYVFCSQDGQEFLKLLLSKLEVVFGASQREVSDRRGRAAALSKQLCPLQSNGHAGSVRLRSTIQVVLVSSDVVCLWLSLLLHFRM